MRRPSISSAVAAGLAIGLMLAAAVGAMAPPQGTRPESSRIASPWMIAAAGSKVYFSGRDPEAGVELWAVDDEAEGAVGPPP